MLVPIVLFFFACFPEYPSNLAQTFHENPNHDYDGDGYTDNEGDERELSQAISSTLQPTTGKVRLRSLGGMMDYMCVGIDIYVLRKLASKRASLPEAQNRARRKAPCPIFGAILQPIYLTKH